MCGGCKFPRNMLLIFFLFSLLLQGNKRTLQYDDVFDTPAALKTANLYPGFNSRFDSLIAAAENNGDKVNECLELSFLSLFSFTQHFQLLTTKKIQLIRLSTGSNETGKRADRIDVPLSFRNNLGTAPTPHPLCNGPATLLLWHPIRRPSDAQANRTLPDSSRSSRV